MKFIKVHSDLINVESISKVNFISNDFYLGDFPKGEEGEYLIEFIPFNFASIELFSGEVINLTVDLYSPEEDEEIEDWYKRNLKYIDISWNKLEETLGEIIQITEYEYLE